MMKKLFTYFFVAMFMISFVSAIEIKNIKIQGVGGTLQSGTTEDIKSIVVNDQVSLLKTDKWYLAWATWIVNSVKLLFAPSHFLQSGIDWADLTLAEKNQIRTYGTLNFDPAQDPRYKTTQEIVSELGLDQNKGTSGTLTGTVAYLDETVYSYRDGNTVVQKVSPTYASTCAGMDISACSSIIPIYYTNKLDGTPATALTIAGRTEMDFRPASLGGESWTLKEYVPQGTQTTYLYDRSGTQAIVERVDLSSAGSSQTPTKTTSEVVVAEPKPTPDIIEKTAEPLTDNTMIYVGVALLVLVITIVATIMLTKKKRR